MRCVGYRQAWQFLDGAHRRATACARTGIAATRQLAKRQLTWLRARRRPRSRPAIRPIVDFVARDRTLGAQRDYAIMDVPVAPSNPANGDYPMARTLYDKLWDSHVVREEADGTALLYIDRHLVHEVTSPQAYEGLKLAGRKPWRVDSVVATADHNTPTKDWDKGIADPISRTAGRDARRQHQASTARRRISRSSTGARASCT